MGGAPALSRSLGALALACGLLACNEEPSAPIPNEQDEAPPLEHASAQPTEPQYRAPERRRAVQGLAGFVSSSTLTFEGREDLPQFSFETVYVFPERVRWRQQPLAEVNSRAMRSVRFQYGAGVWELPMLAERSVHHTGQEARVYRLQNELRRVAMTWPAGLEWQEVSEKPLERLAALEGLGQLRVLLDEATQRPLSIESSMLGETEPFESFTEIQWRAEGDRHWPRSWTLVGAGLPIWHETIDVVETGRHFLDSFFRPTDLRTASAPASEPRLSELEARVVLRAELAASTRWADALQIAQSAATKAAATLRAPHLLDPRPVFTLDARGQPTGYELRLQVTSEELPEGWQRVPAGASWSVVLPGLESLTPQAIETLEKRLLSGQLGGIPFVRVQHEGGRVGMVQLDLPFTAEH